MKQVITILMVMAFSSAMGQTVRLRVSDATTPREEYAAEYLQGKLQALGYQLTEKKRCDYQIFLNSTGGGKAESFTIHRKGKKVTVSGADGSGLIYGCVELADQLREHRQMIPEGTYESTPEMVLRGACASTDR